MIKIVILYRKMVVAVEKIISASGAGILDG